MHQKRFCVFLFSIVSTGRSDRVKIIANRLCVTNRDEKKNKQNAKYVTLFTYKLYILCDTRRACYVRHNADRRRGRVFVCRRSRLTLAIHQRTRKDVAGRIFPTLERIHCDSTRRDGVRTYRETVIIWLCIFIFFNIRPFRIFDITQNTFYSKNETNQ